MTASKSLHVVFGTGPLGRAIANQLAQTGAEVRILSRSGSIRIPGVESISVDLMDPTSATSAAKGANVIYQCAAPPYQDWARSFSALQEGAIAAASRSGAVLVAAENLYGYGVAGRLHEHLPLTATTRKGAARARMTRRLFQAHEGGEIRAVSGRAADFFGPDVESSALGDRFWPALLRGRPIDWFGDADKMHTFTYLPDFASALITLGSTPDSWGRPWHVPSPETMSTRKVATLAAKFAGVPPPKFRRTPKLMLRLVGLAIPAAGETVEMEYSWADDFVMSHDAWKARFAVTSTSWEQALRTTIEAFKLKLAANNAA